MLDFIRFVHVTAAITLIGFYLFSFVVVSLAIGSGRVISLRNTLLASLLGDIFMFLLLIILLVTGALLVSFYHLSFTVPWILVAAHVSVLVGLMLVFLFVIKLKNYTAALQNPFRFKKLFFLLNVLILVLLVLSVHDAVTQTTWFFLGAR